MRQSASHHFNHWWLRTLTFICIDNPQRRHLWKGQVSRMWSGPNDRNFVSGFMRTIYQGGTGNLFVQCWWVNFLFLQIWRNATELITLPLTFPGNIHHNCVGVHEQFVYSRKLCIMSVAIRLAHIHYGTTDISLSISHRIIYIYIFMSDMYVYVI